MDQKIFCLTLTILISVSFGQNVSDIKQYEKDTILYEEKDLYQRSLYELRLMRNEIFARYGRTFRDQSLQEHFSKKDWYYPNPNYTDNLLSEADLTNISTLIQLEAKIKRKWSAPSTMLKFVDKRTMAQINSSHDLCIVRADKKDFTGDNNPDLIVLTIPWQWLSYNGHIDPGDYTGIQLFKLVNQAYERVEVKIKDRDIIKYGFSGEKFSITSNLFHGNDYMKFCDLNKNGVMELVIKEYDYASMPGVFTILEFRDGIMSDLYSDERDLDKIADVNSDGLHDIIVSFGGQPWGTVPGVVAYSISVMINSKEAFVYSQSHSSDYIWSLARESISELERNGSKKVYFETLRLLMSLCYLGDEEALKLGKETIRKHNPKFASNSTSFEGLSNTEEVISDFEMKAEKKGF